MKNFLKMLSVGFAFCLFLSGCVAEEEVSANDAEKVQADQDAQDSCELVYLKAVDAEASSFDRTPDWAPEPDAMAPVSGDRYRRWSSDYVEGEPWIYFDLGEERAISNIVIFWEEAFPVEYKVFVSDDASDWQKIYHETESEGGKDEFFIDPVEGRYVKVRGLEKKNPEWGMSIWEVEIYGPAGENPGAEFTKTAYELQADGEKFREQADKKIEKYAAEVVPIDERPFQKGVVYTSWVDDEFLLSISDLTLVELKKMGFDTISIMVPGYQEDLYSEEVYVHDGEGGDTPSVEAIEHAIETCHRLGMRVHLKPHVDPRTDEPRINIVPSDEWFDSYEAFILKYAEVAERMGIEIYSVGTELEATTFSLWDERWRELIENVRDVFSGHLTYAANWTEYEGVPFWDALDILGIDAYFPLTDKDDPTLEDLVDAWTEIADDIERWLEEEDLSDKPLIFSEVGYPSAKGGARRPWVAMSDIVDEQVQVDGLEAMFIVLPEREWFEGYYLWQYFPQERYSPLGFTLRGKKAEEVISEYLKK